MTVGTGIGGGLVIDRRVHGTDRPAAAEIGHLRPGLSAMSPHQTVEAEAAGPAIEARMQHRIREIFDSGIDDPDAMILNEFAGQLHLITAKQIVLRQHKEIGSLDRFIAKQPMCSAGLLPGDSLVSPEIVVVGGGVRWRGRMCSMARCVKRSSATCSHRSLEVTASSRRNSGKAWWCTGAGVGGQEFGVNTLQTENGNLG